MFELTIRHIRYGVRSEYLNPFGNALFATFEEVLSRLFDLLPLLYALSPSMLLLEPFFILAFDPSLPFPCIFF